MRLCRQDWERWREGCGPDAATAAAVCAPLVFVCLGSRRLCQSKTIRHDRRYAANARLAPHPLSVLLSQDSDTQMLVGTAANQLRGNQERERKKRGRRGRESRAALHREVDNNKLMRRESVREVTNGHGLR